MLVFGATALVHLLLGLAPGDSSACGDSAAPVGLLTWWAGALGGSLQPPCFGPAATVGGLLAPALLRTLGLVAAATLLGGLVSVLGLLIGWRPVRTALRTAGAVPAFVLAYGAASLLDAWTAPCLARGDCPAWFPLQAHDSGLGFWVAAAVLGLGSGQIGAWTRGLRGELDRARRADWVVFELGCGQPEAAVMGRALAGPLAGLTVDRAVAALAEAVVVEAVVGTRGLGTLTWEAARFRDVTVLLAVTAVWALVLAVLRDGAAALGRLR